MKGLPNLVPGQGHERWYTTERKVVVIPITTDEAVNSQFIGERGTMADVNELTDNGWIVEKEETYRTHLVYVLIRSRPNLSIRPGVSEVVVPNN